MFLFCFSALIKVNFCRFSHLVIIRKPFEVDTGKGIVNLCSIKLCIRPFNNIQDVTFERPKFFNFENDVISNQLLMWIALPFL